jgi:uncharacterized metal-binding protein YceD (DUF177 family)
MILVLMIRSSAQREESIIKQAKVEVKVLLRKDSGGMHLNLSMIGDVAVDCVRCLEGFRLPIEIEKSLLVKMVDEVNEEYDDEDEIYITKKAIEIDLAHSPIRFPHLRNSHIARFIQKMKMALKLVILKS